MLTTAGVNGFAHTVQAVLPASEVFHAESAQLVHDDALFRWAEYEPAEQSWQVQLERYAPAAQS
jgi:hypothetical protein